MKMFLYRCNHFGHLRLTTEQEEQHGCRVLQRCTESECKGTMYKLGSVELTGPIEEVKAAA